MQNQASEGLPNMTGYNGALGFEQEENVLLAAVERFEISLAFGNDQASAGKTTLKLRAAGFEHDSCAIITCVHQGYGPFKTCSPGVCEQGVIDGWAALNNHSNFLVWKHFKQQPIKDQLTRVIGEEQDVGRTVSFSEERSHVAG
jgi:hypothetical protein